MGRIIARVQCPSTGKIFEAALEIIETQSLFVQTNRYNDFPEIYHSDGSQYIVATLIGVAAGKTADKIQQLAKTAQHKIALTKLEKGYMVDNTGRVFQAIATRKGTERIQKRVIYTNDGICMEVMMGKHTTFSKNKELFTTKGIDPVKYFSEHGAKAKALGLLRQAGKILDVFDIYLFTSDIQSGSTSLSSLPGLTPATAAISGIGMIADMKFKELEADLEAEREKMLEKAKQKGLVAVETLVNTTWRSWNGNSRELRKGEIKYILEDITQETASKILQGKFRTYEEMLRSNYKTGGLRNITVLIKRIGGGSNDDKHIIQTFFIKD